MKAIHVVIARIVAGRPWLMSAKHPMAQINGLHGRNKLNVKVLGALGHLAYVLKECYPEPPKLR